MNEMSEEMWKSGKCFTGAGTTDSTTSGKSILIYTACGVPKVHLDVAAATPTISKSFTKPKPIKKFVNPSLSGPSTVKVCSSTFLIDTYMYYHYLL